MNEKSIHIVFQVLNWLHSDYSLPFKLLPNECRLLINFASHKGIKGIYPSVTTLMKELKLSNTQIYRVIKSLEKKKLISVDRKIGVSNHYYLTIPFEKLSTTPCTDERGMEDEPLACTTRVPLAPMPQTPCTGDTLITKKNKKKNREALSADFAPNQKTKAGIKELGYSPDEISLIADEFMSYYLNSDELSEDWDKKALQWFKREKRKPGFLEKKVEHQPQRSTYVEQEDPPRTRESYHVEQQAMSTIFRKLGMTNRIKRNLDDDEDVGRIKN